MFPNSSLSSPQHAWRAYLPTGPARPCTATHQQHVDLAGAHALDKLVDLAVAAEGGGDEVGIADTVWI